MPCAREAEASEPDAIDPGKDRVSELDLTACTRLLSREVIENGGVEDVSADAARREGASSGKGFPTNPEARTIRPSTACGARNP